MPLPQFPTPPWYTDEYGKLRRVEYDAASNVLTVEFANSEVVRLDPAVLIPPDLQDVDWSDVAFNRWLLLVPHAEGWFEVPYDVVRVHTDPAFARHLEAMAERSAATDGRLLRALRQELGLTLDTVAERAGITPVDLAAVEAGDLMRSIPYWEVLEALGLPHWYLTVLPDEPDSIARLAS